MHVRTRLTCGQRGRVCVSDPELSFYAEVSAGEVGSAAPVTVPGTADRGPDCFSPQVASDTLPFCSEVMNEEERLLAY